MALQEIGPAVLNGGISTFIALGLLGTSRSYVFLSFFKVFTLVIVFGLYHGLIFLPVLLSLVGPASYSTSSKEVSEDPKNEVEHNSSEGQEQDGVADAKKEGIANTNSEIYRSTQSVITYI